MSGMLAWRMMRARRDPWAVALLASGWLAARLPIPWLGGLRAGTLLWAARTAADSASRRRWLRRSAGLGLLAFAGASWLVLCGGVLIGMSLFGHAAVSVLGLAVFLVVPAGLAAAAAGAIVWRLDRSARSVAGVALPVVGLWWVVSAVAAYAACFRL